MPGCEMNLFPFRLLLSQMIHSSQRARAGRLRRDDENINISNDYKDELPQLTPTQDKRINLPG